MEEDTGPLPLPPLTARPATEAVIARLPWRSRWRQRLGQYLPVLLMGVLALATGWLLRQSPTPSTPGSREAPSGEPDYEMEGFSIQRYTDTGPAQGVIEGDRVRHYPGSDQFLIDGVRVRWTDRDGRVLRASATRAVAEGDGSQVRLDGLARVVRDPAPGDTEPFEFTSESMLFDVTHGQVRSDARARLMQGNDVFEASRLIYDHPSRQLDLAGGVTGRLSSRSPRGTPP